MHKNTQWNVDAVHEFEFGNITSNGVVYCSELHSAEGIAALLIKDSTQTMDDLKKAEKEMYFKHDVVVIEWCDMKPEEEEKILKRKKELEKELSPEEKIATLRKIMTHGYDWVGTAKVDSYTASAIIAVYDGLSEEKNRKKFSSMPLVRMADLAFKIINSIESKK